MTAQSQALQEAKQTLAKHLPEIDGYSFKTKEKLLGAMLEYSTCQLEEKDKEYNRLGKESLGNALKMAEKCFDLKKEIVSLKSQLHQATSGERHDGNKWLIELLEESYDAGSNFALKRTDDCFTDKFQEEKEKFIKTLKLTPPTNQRAGLGLEDKDIVEKRTELLNDGKPRSEQQFAIDIVRWALQSLPHQSTGRFSDALEQIKEVEDELLHLCSDYDLTVPIDPHLLNLRDKCMRIIKLLPSEPTEVKEGREVEFTDWVSDNYSRVYSDELKISKYVSLDAPIYVHGSDSYRTQLIHTHGKTTKDLYQLFLTQSK